MSAVGCLSGRAWRVGGITDAKCSRVGGVESASLTLLSDIEGVGFGLISGITSAAAGHVGGIKSAACSLVCSLDGTVYLRVRPEDVQWITMEMGIDYDVISNTNWNVE